MLKILLLLFSTFIISQSPPSPTLPDIETNLPLENINLPDGFQIHVYAQNITGARSMSLADDGTLFVGTRQQGLVYALRDADDDNYAESVHIVAQGLTQPNGVAYHDGSLYVADISRILRYDEVLQAVDEQAQPQAVTVFDDFLPDIHHGWKYLRVGPDEMLYVPQGAPCNVCASSPDYAYISRLNLDGTGFEIVATGIRNTVGFDWHPETEDLWFTDNGRDMLGDDLPADELNHVSEIGQHFGFPHCFGADVVDPDYGYSGACEDFTLPVQELGPHVASLGIRFYTGEQFPEAYLNQPFIAEHGSWNRSERIGYRVTNVLLNEDGESEGYEVFADGWLLDNGNVWGRPVDILMLPDGSLLVSDDYAGAIYRIVYTGE